MKQKKIILLVSVIFYSLLLFSVNSLKVYADINVSSWKYIGDSLQDYELNGYFASQIKGTDKIDLRKDIIYLGYRGNNISEDTLLNGFKVPVNEKKKMTSTYDFLRIKKMGVVDGKYIDVFITPVQVPLEFTISDSNLNNMINFNSSNFNLDGNKYHIRLRFYYEGTNIEVNTDKHHFVLPITETKGWKEYISATLLSRDTKVLIGDKERDELARIATRTFTDYYNYRLAIGNAPGKNSTYYYNFLFEKTPFYYGFQGSTGFDSMSFAFFDPITSENSIPKPYNDILFSNIDNKDGNLKNEILYTLPSQDSEAYFPESIVIDYSKYNSSDTLLTVPVLTIDDYTIPSEAYQIDNANNLVFNKSFLQTYAGKEIKITNYTEIDYSSERILTDYYKKDSKKFNIPYGVKVTSNYDSFSQIEFTEESLTDVTYPLEFKTIDLNAEVELGSKTIDYSPSDYLTASTNFPNDDVRVSLPTITFDNFVEETSFNVTLSSQKLGIDSIFNVKPKVFKKIPIKYQLNTGEIIAATEENMLPKEKKSFYNQNVIFDIPTIFDSYRFNSVKTSGFTAVPLENNQHRITGGVLETTKEIVVVYEWGTVNVTVEYLLDGLGEYNTHRPIKEGDTLDVNKKSITIEAEIGESIAKFIERNKLKVIPNIDYYKSHLDSGLTSNYWHFTDQPVNEENPSNSVNSKVKIPKDPITITTLYSGTTSLKYVDSINFGTHTNNLSINEIRSKKPINYYFIDTTIGKKNSLNLKVDTDDLQEKMAAFTFEYKGNTINNEDTMIVESSDKDKNIFEGDLKSNLLFKRYWLGPENVGEFNTTLIWTISRDITL